MTPSSAAASGIPPTATGTLATANTNLREFLAFKLGAEEYGIDILRVQEIRSYEEPTRIANAPGFIKGVVNLRGVIVPIVDMRIKFNLESVNYDSFTVVIVLNIAGRVVGMVVDAVSDVITLTPEQLRPVPEFPLVFRTGRDFAGTAEAVSSLSAPTPRGCDHLILGRKRAPVISPFYAIPSSVGQKSPRIASSSVKGQSFGNVASGKPVSPTASILALL